MFVFNHILITSFSLRESDFTTHKKFYVSYTDILYIDTWGENITNEINMEKLPFRNGVICVTIGGISSMPRRLGSVHL
jgi:hypothetical protein